MVTVMISGFRRVLDWGRWQSTLHEWGYCTYCTATVRIGASIKASAAAVVISLARQDCTKQGSAAPPLTNPLTSLQAGALRRARFP